MSYALVFAGQGMQHPAMLSWLAEDDAPVGKNWRSALEDPAWAANNANAQLLLTGVNLAAWARLSAALPRPAAVAGYSVGELASFAAAGVFDAATALRLAGLRARAMDRCPTGGLLAVSGLAALQIEHLCAATGASVAIENGSHAFVLGGPQAALDAAEQAAAGAHCTRLKVNVASHTPLMQGAAQEFAQALAALDLQAPAVPLFSNAADRIWNGPQAARALALQIARTVRWSACMEQIRSRQVDCVLEIGPGAALARMWNELYPEIPARSADEFRSAQAVVDWVLRQGKS